MTRARCYALALMVGVCCLGQTQAFAQPGPGPQPGYGPGYPTPPTEAPPPMGTTPWYGTAEDVEPSINMFGPQAKVNSWFLRAEYLNWNIGSPGNVPIGAPVAGVPNYTKPFLIFAPNTQTAIAYGQVPTTDSMRLTDTSGIQVTTGLDLIDGGQIEVSAFMLGKKQTGFSTNYANIPLFDPAQLLFHQYGIGTGVPGTQGLVPNVAATSTLANGQLSNHLFLYNQSFAATYISQLWGGEANYLIDDYAGDVAQFLPLIGARYINLTEHMNVNGVFADQFNPGSITNTSIQSMTMNNLWGGQIGFRAQIVTKYLEFGATPKLLVLGNTAVSGVDTQNFRFAGDTPTSASDVTTKFTFGGEVNGFVNINITPTFTVRGGYTLLWINQVTRPNRDIVYNDNGNSSPIGISQQFVFHDIFINGFNFGCELRF